MGSEEKGGIGLPNRGKLDFGKISEKLVKGRKWVETRYYTAPVNIQERPDLYRQQRWFFSKLSRNPQITIHLGRLERRSQKNDLAFDILRYLANLKEQIPPQIYSDLHGIARENRYKKYSIEKAVDVKLAIDLVSLAREDVYDIGYLVSGDGDFVPAVKEAQKHGKKIFCASPINCYALINVADAYIRLYKDWFQDCYES